MNRVIILFFFVALFYIPNAIAQNVDTLITKDLSEKELVISAFSFRLPSKNATQSLALLNYKQLKSGDGSSIQSALNSIPGVFFESRGNGGSPRINIRGSMFRSAYGIRNVRMYWEGFAITSPDGTTPFEAIDPSWIETVEVIKGPASVQYGNGTGGILLMHSQNPQPEKYAARYQQTIGSYGFAQRHLRVTIPLRTIFSFNQRFLTVSSSSSTTHGYRQQEANERNQGMVVLRKKVALPFWSFRGNGNYRGENISVAQYYNGGWQLPGSLNQSEALSNPQQARPYSIDHDAHLNRKRWILGYGQDRSGDDWNLTWRASVIHTNKENPYGTSASNQGYKLEKSLDKNAIANASKTFGRGHDLTGEWQFGGEYQNEYYRIQECNNDNGNAGSEKYHFDVHYNQYFGFSSFQLKWKDKGMLQLGSAWHNTQMDVSGQYGNKDFQDNIQWKPGWTPRMAMSWEPIQNWVLFASTSTGFCNPNFYEQVDYQNSQYNNQLTPEWGSQKEWGLRWMKETFSFEIVGYNQKMKSLILPTSITSEAPWTYGNGGSSNILGGECSFKKTVRWGKSRIESQGAFHWGDYRWSQWTVANQSFDGKKIPGNSGHAAHFMLTYDYQDKYFIILQDQWMDKMALNNENSLFSNPYHVVNGKLMGVINTQNAAYFQGYFKWEAGVNNLLNAQYCSFWQWNDANNRFYNPSPIRNFYFGLTWFFSK